MSLNQLSYYLFYGLFLYGFVSPDFKQKNYTHMWSRFAFLVNRKF